jgi:hypothetical protein
VPQREKLDVALERIGATGEQAQGCTEREIDEAKGHSGILPTRINPCSRAEFE